MNWYTDVPNKANELESKQYHWGDKTIQAAKVDTPMSEQDQQANKAIDSDHEAESDEANKAIEDIKVVGATKATDAVGAMWPL